jgi:hypothetical protein
MDESTLPPWGLPRWAPEFDPTSKATMGKSSTEFSLEYSLGAGEAAYQAAALRLLTYGGVLTGADTIAFSARADRPMRLSVQARGDERWQRSIYVDTIRRTHSLRFDDFRPIGVTSVARPPVPELHSIMWVVDTTNTLPGTSGRFWIGDVSYVRTSQP